MPKQIFGTDAVVVSLNRAFNDQSPSYATFNNQVASAGTTPESQAAFAKTFGAGFAGLTADALSTKLLGNLGVLPNADLQKAVADYITSVGVANVGIVAWQLADILSNLENATGAQAAFSPAAAAWNNEVAASFNYSANPANTSAGPTGTDDTSTTGVTLTLTSATDFVAPNSTEAKFKTTANNDTIQATSGNTLLDGTDTIDGGSGKDTLNALIANANVAPTISNVEIINLTTADGASSFNANGVTGAQQIWLVGGGTSAADTPTLNNVDKSFTVGLKAGSNAAGATDAVVNFKAAQVSGLADTVSVALGGFNTLNNGTTTAASSLKIDSVETLNLASGTSANGFTLKGDSFETVNITGDKALSLALDASVRATIKTIDGSAATSSLTVTTGALTQTAVTVKTGTGADSVDLTGAGQKVTADLGAGNDTITFDANKAHAITLGAGNDTVQLTATGAIKETTAATINASAVTISDFVVGTDKIKIAAGDAIKTLTGTQFSAVQGASDLKAAVTAAATAAATTVGDVVFFQFGADTYVYRDNDAGAVGATDSLIKLTGVTANIGDAILIA